MTKISFRIGVALFTCLLGIAASLLWQLGRDSVTEIKAGYELSGVSQPASDVKKDLPILAYCELANNPQRYNGKTVRVSARLYESRHGILFYDLNCSDGDRRSAVIYAPAHIEAIERKLKQAGGSDNWWELLDIIATGTFKKVTPSDATDTIYDTAPFHLEIIRIEKAVKAR